MKFALEPIGNKLMAFFQGNSQIDELRRQMESSGQKDNGKRLSFNISKYRTYKAEMQQDELRKAITLAEDPVLPDRTLLLSLYREAMRDPHLRSQIRTNILKVIGSPWAWFVEGTDEIDEGLTRLMQKAWFQRYRYIFHETPYYGHQLVEFQQMQPAKSKGVQWEFKHVKVFPREYVRPSTGEIIFDPSADKGIPYREEPWNTWLVEMGDPDDLGLLNIAAREVIWKNYSRTDWSRLCEKFGMPLLAIKSASSKKEELEKLEDMAANFGSNLWVILDDEDEVEIKETSKTDGHKIFEDKIRYCDEQVSKVVSGQTGSSDEKSFVGSAEVHERILNEYMEEAMRNESYHINDDLKVFLIRHGYPLEGREFRYLAFMKDDKEDNKGDQPPDKEIKSGGQKDTVNFTEPLAIAVAGGMKGRFAERVSGWYASGCCQPVAAGPGSVADLERLAKGALEHVYRKKLKAGQVDGGLWKATTDRLWKGVTKGYEVTNLSKVVYGSPDHVLLTNLRYNVQVFAAFKNHHHTNELVKALVDDDGQVRSFSGFKKAAGMVNVRYHNNWLRAEYNQAVAAARNAQRWQKVQVTKDIFPNVEYVAVMDGRVSPVCRDLNGGIWAIDDPVLDVIAPGNHWGCRSFLRKTRKTVVKKETGEEIREGFRNNPGKSGHPFNWEHPYYEVTDQFKDAAKRVFGLKSQLAISGVELQRNLKIWEGLDPKDFEKKAFSESGGFVAVHKLAHTKDLFHNKKIGTVLAKNGHGVVIAEHVEDGTPNPEMIINGVVSDVKSPKSPYSLDNLLKSASKRQGLNNVVYEVTKRVSLKEISLGLRRGFHNRSKIEWVHVVYDQKELRITRKMYEYGAILKELERVWK